ncbi:MAG: hypothetical protein WBP29_13320 [Candidatus Zixiibacteriota bacterium]
MQIAWSENLRAGIAEIDSQHMRLIEQANHLQKLIEDGIDPSERRRVLNSLVDFVRMHFSTGEKPLIGATIQRRTTSSPNMKNSSR